MSWYPGDLNSFQIPKDYDRFPEMRRLESALAALPEQEHHRLAPIIANHIFTSLFVELTYQVEGYITPTPTLGSLPKCEYASWFKSLGLDWYCAADWLLEQLIEASILRDEGEFWFCHLYFVTNQDLDRAHRLGGVKLRENRVIAGLLQRLRKAVPEEVKSLTADYYTIVDNQRITPQEMNRLIVLVRVLDAIFGVVRDRAEYDVGTLQDACRVVRKYTPEQLDLLLRRLMARRNYPGVPITTVKMLRNFDMTVGSVLAPEQGWDTWAKPAMLTQRQTPASNSQ